MNISIRDRRGNYLENVGWLLELREKALKKEKWLEAYLLTFFRIELGLHLMVDYKMTMGKIEYSDEFLGRILYARLGFAELVNLFCSIHGDKLFHALDTVRKERNDFIHNFSKKPKRDFINYVEDLCLSALLVDNALSKFVREIRQS